MKLSSQLFGLVFAMMLLFLLGSLQISINSSRSDLEEELGHQAEDTATSLGLSLMPVLDDPALLETMIDAIFDRGYYQRIALVDVEGHPLVLRTLPVVINKVPAWFVDWYELDAPAAEAEISNGWVEFGQLEVQRHPGVFYAELWHRARDIFWLSLGVFGVALALATLLLRVILTPLREIEQQAQGISERKFYRIAKLPKTRELRSLANAMNQMVGNLESSFEQLSSNARRLHTVAYVDSLTQLQNRRSFENQLNHRLEDTQEDSSGFLMFIRIGEFQEFRRRWGYRNGDEYITQLSAAISVKLESFAEHVNDRTPLFRVSDSDFAVLLPYVDNKLLERLCEELIGRVQNLPSRIAPVSNVYVGITDYRAGDGYSSVMNGADLALAEVEYNQASGYKIRSSQTMVEGQPTDLLQWKQAIEEQLDNHSFTQWRQAIVSDRSGPTLYSELLTRFPLKDQGQLRAGEVFAMAKRLQLVSRLARENTRRALNWLGEEPKQVVGVNLTIQSIADEDFIGWLAKFLAREPSISRRLVFEVTEADCYSNLGATAAFFRLLQKVGSRCCIEHFGNSPQGFRHLRELRPDFIKIDGRYTRQLSANGDTHFFIQTLVQIAHTLEIKVIAEQVENQDQYQMLRDSHVDGFQGYLIEIPRRLGFAGESAGVRDGERDTHIVADGKRDTHLPGKENGKEKDTHNIDPTGEAPTAA